MSSNTIYPSLKPEFTCSSLSKESSALEFECAICQKQYGTMRSLSKHITQTHKYTPKEYYDQFLRKDQEGICPECGKETKFRQLSASNGYTTHCGNVCAQISHKRDLKADPNRYKQFIKNCKSATKEVWDSYDKSSKKERLNHLSSIRERLHRMISISTLVERQMMFSRYHKCDQETIERLNRKGREQLLINYMNGLGGNKTYMKGMFKPRNPEKYAGNPENIVYRSSWELRFMSHLDKNDNVIQWSSEELFIEYFDPTTNRIRRYFPDFIVKVKDKNGIIKTTMIEIKPENQTLQPKKPENKKREKYFMREMALWGKNMAKWKYAEEYCKDRGWTFQILTEKHIFKSE